VARTPEDRFYDNFGVREPGATIRPTAGAGTTIRPAARVGAALASGRPVDGFIVLDSEPGRFVFGAWKNVLVIVWKSQATAKSVARFSKTSDMMAARWPGCRSNVHVIQDGAALPTSEARAGFLTLMKRNRESLACIAIVIAGNGFWSGALRSAMTGLRMLAPRSFAFRVVGSSEDVVQWLPAAHEAKTGVSLDPRRLKAVLDEATGASKPVPPRGP
jgi:hypothetical protein